MTENQDQQRYQIQIGPGWVSVVDTLAEEEDVETVVKTFSGNGRLLRASELAERLNRRNAHQSAVARELASYEIDRS